MRPLTLAVAIAWVTTTWLGGAQVPATLPAQSDSVKFAVIGDSGTWAPAQYDIGTGVNVVFSGHDHTERIQPRKGITSFVSGSAGELRKGDVRPSASTAAYFDQDQSFMLVEIDGDSLNLQSKSRTGQTVDSGVIRLPAERLTR